jgi:opacity protein-like surface antigen
MKRLLATTLLAFALATPAMAFDINSIDGIPSDIKDTIAKQSGGRVTNKQSQQQAGQDGQQQQQGGRQRQQRLSKQDRAMQQAEQFMNGGGNGGGVGGQGIGQGIGSFR